MVPFAEVDAGRRMYVVAVTGGVASGKSAVTRRFEALGVPVIDADVVSRELVEPGQPALAEIAARFGAGVIAADGSLDRRALRQRVFAAPAEREALEAILHPRVRAVMRERATPGDHPAPYVIVAVPLLAESRGDWSWVDRVLVVDVPRSVQLARLVARDGVDAAAAEAMVAAQATRKRRMAIADDVVVNDGPIDALDRAVAMLDGRYRGLALAGAHVASQAGAGAAEVQEWATGTRPGRR